METFPQVGPPLGFRWNLGVGLVTYANVLQWVQLIVKDRTSEVSKAGGQSSSTPKKPWRGGNQQKRKYDSKREGTRNHFDRNKRAVRASN